MATLHPQAAQAAPSSSLLGESRVSSQEFGPRHVAGFAAALASVLIALTGCGVEVQGPEPPTDRFVYPVGMALHPNGRYLYVVSSNFDVEFRQDRGGTVSVVDTDRLEIVQAGGAQIGTFGGDIALNSPGGGAPTRAYVAVRGDSSVTALEIEGGGGQLRCKGASRSAACQLPTGSDDPFGLLVDSTVVSDPVAGEVPIDFVAVAHLVGGNITAFAIKGDDAKNNSRVSAPLVAGAYAIARSPRTGQYYATSRFTNTVVSFRPVYDATGAIEAIFELDEISIDNAAPFSGLDSRGIAFNNDGTMAFVANRGPNSLLFVDVGPTNLENFSGSRNQLVDILPMPSGPAKVEYINFGDTERVYVSSYADELIVVVDPASHRIVQTIDIPGKPYTMVVDQVRHQRLYVTLFNANAVAVIDIDPDSPSFNEVVSVVK